MNQQYEVVWSKTSDKPSNDQQSTHPWIFCPRRLRWWRPTEPFCPDTLGPPTTQEGTDTFSTGATRESKTNKSRPALICTFLIEALGFHMSFGARGHGARNWEKGIPDESYADGLARHHMLLQRGCNAEDHASAMIFNIMGLRRNAETGNAGGTPIKIFTIEQWKEKMEE